MRWALAPHEETTELKLELGRNPEPKVDPGLGRAGMWNVGFNPGLDDLVMVEGAVTLFIKFLNIDIIVPISPKLQ